MPPWRMSFGGTSCAAQPQATAARETPLVKRRKANSTGKRRPATRAAGRTANSRPGPIDRFIALPDAEKQRIWESYNRHVPLSETRPLTPAERKRWEKARKRMRSAESGKGAKVISLSVEGGLLERVDAYARKNGISRAQLFARGVETLLAEAG